MATTLILQTLIQTLRERVAETDGAANCYREAAAPFLAKAEEKERESTTMKETIRLLERDLMQQSDSARTEIEPSPDMPETTDAAQRKGGRKRGSISRSWQNVLWDVRKNGNALRFEDFYTSAKNLNMPIKIAAVRERVRRSIKMEYIFENSDGTFSVTDNAIQKFSLDSESIPHPDAVSENETSPDLESEDAHS